MREADPVNHVELRHNQHGHESVVFSFPYRADIVDAVRSIPGRRFDWQAKEWWAPRADATAAYVQGVIERFPELEVAPEVETWLARAVKGWVGRVSAARRDGKGWFVLDAIAGELPEELLAVAEERGDRRWLPFTEEVARTLLDLPGARLDPRALRCATRLQVGLQPAPATLTLVESYGEPRFKLEVNWDPDTVGAFVELPAAEAHGRTLPVDPYLLEPLEHFIRLHGIDVGENARDALARLRIEHDAAIGAVRRSRASDGDLLECEAAPRRRAAAVPARRRRLRAAVAAAVHRRRAGPGQDRRGARGARGGRRLPGGRHLPGVAEAQLAARDRALAAAPLAARRRRHRQVVPEGRHHGPQLRDRPRAPRAARGRPAQGADPRRVPLRQEPAGQAHASAVRRLAEALPEGALKLALTGTPVMNHPDELIAQLRILGRLEEFGSGARFKRRFQGAGAEERIHWHLRRTCFVRRLKKDVLPQLPEKRQVIVPVALENEKEYRLAERDVVAWLQEQPLELAELESKVAATLRAERLAQLNTLRRLAARGKLGAAMAWIDDFLQSEEPLVVFASHREIQEMVVQRFPDALHVVGADKATERDARRPGLPGPRRPAADRLLDARRRPGHHADPRVQRRLPRARVEPGDARPGRGPPPPDRPARRRHRLVPARRRERSTSRWPRCWRASAGSSAPSPTASATSPRQ